MLVNLYLEQHTGNTSIFMVKHSGIHHYGAAANTNTTTAWPGPQDVCQKGILESLAKQDRPMHSSE